MKNILLLINIVIIFLFLSSSNIESKELKLNENINLTNDDSKWSLDEYQEITYYLLNPYLSDEIDKYYSKYLTISPMVYPYYPYTEVLSIEKTHSGPYLIKFRIKSVTGPHIQIGTDDITFKIGTGNVEVVKYEHIKSYELPERYEKYIKEGYNNPIP